MECGAANARHLPILPEYRAGWQALLDLVPVAAYACDAEGRITYCNTRAVSVWGRSVTLRDPCDRYCGSHKLYHPDGTPLPHSECWMARALLEKRSYNGRTVLIERPDGSRVQGLVFANPVHSRWGQVIGAVNLIVNPSLPHTASVAIVNVVVAVLAGPCWPASAFN